jgi:hypothetical protein
MLMKKQRSQVSRKSKSPESPEPSIRVPGWTFLSNHSHVLLCLYRNSAMTLREVAFLVRITERMVQKIVAELVQAGYLQVTKIGRRNTYQIDVNKKLRHSLESHCRIGDLLENLRGPE